MKSPFSVGKLYSYGHLTDLQFKNLKSRFVELYTKLSNIDEEIQFNESNVFAISKDEILLYLGCEHYKKNNFEGLAYTFLRDNKEKVMLVLKDETDKKLYAVLRKSLKEVNKQSLFTNTIKSVAKFA